MQNKTKRPGTETEKARSIRSRMTQIGAYLFWGACATAVNIAAFHALRANEAVSLLPANLAAWLVSIVFAFITNRRFVFAPPQSDRQSGDRSAGLREFRDFLASRISTGILDMGCMWLGSEMLRIPELELKIAVNALVIAANYFLSLLFVFRRRSHE